MRKNAFLIVTAVCSLILGRGNAALPQQEEPDIIIAQYGKVLVQSSVPDARVFIDDIYKAAAGTIIEKVLVGDHTITCRAGSQAVSGSFSVKKNETLKLEARFKEGKLTPVIEHAKIEKPEPEPEPVKQEAPKIVKPKPEKPKRHETAAKKEEPRNSREERRALHLNVIKIYFIENPDTGRVRITHNANPAVISKFVENKHETGTYYRTKQNLLLCESAPCDQQWSTTFQYTDETGKIDQFGITWKRLVYTGITPTGISERTLVYCLNGECNTLENKSDEEFFIERNTGRYTLIWSKSSLKIRRTDIMLEIRDSGGDLEAY